jgi:hypothetical protein
MGSARVNVWVAGAGEPCRFDLTHQWYVHVLHRDGTVVEWHRDGRERVPLTNIPTECGHAEVEVPPGEHVVVATRSPSADDPHRLGNRVRVERGDRACITLFPSTARFRGTWFQIATNTLIGLGDVDPDLGARAIAAIGKALRGSGDQTGATAVA